MRSNKAVVSTVDMFVLNKPTWNDLGFLNACKKTQFLCFFVDSVSSEST